MKNWTLVEGNNPTKAIEASYQELMAENDAAVLAQKMKVLCLENRIGDANFDKLRLSLMKIDRLPEERKLLDLKRYVTNFMLAGMGMGNEAVGRGR